MTAAYQALSPGLAKALMEMGAVGVLINVVLMALNLIPIPPLDGSRILAGVLPDRATELMRKVEPYGLFLLIALFLTGGLSGLLSVPVSGIINAIHRLYGMG